MRKFLLMSSALVVLSGTAGAGCIQTPSCSSLGYSYSTACEGGLKCPWGNAWFCNVGGGESKPDYSNCKIGDILYSDMTCNSNMIASKTPIGVIFDVTNTLAVAKDEFANMPWGYIGEDVSGLQNYSNATTSTGDWKGFNNTKALYEADKSGVNYPAIKKVLTYSTEGTEQGQWYLPAVGELQEISMNKDTLNTTLSKIGGTQMSGKYWSSSEQNNGSGFLFTIGNNESSTGRKISKNKVKPVINFGSKNKTDFAYVSSNETACGLGSILYSDKKCYAGSAPSEKTPIAIVFDASRRTAIALERSASEIKWGSGDIPGITNTLSESQAKQDFEGKANTAAIKSYNNSLSNYPAAKYAYNYTTVGTNVGDWYLPALGELNTVSSNKAYVDYALSLIDNGVISVGGYYWSSSEGPSYYVWMIEIGNGYVKNRDRSNGYSVLPVLAF